MRPERLKADAAAIDEVGVALHRTETHLGIVRRRGAMRLLLHMLAHRHVRDQPLRSGYLAVEPELLPEERVRLLEWLELLAVRMQAGPPPYGFRITAETLFGPDGVLRLGGAEGLTCATFVVVAFASIGLPLLDPAQWRERPDDAARQNELIAILRSQGVPEEHLARLTSEVGTARLRPEEVAGAALFDDRPVGFADCERAGAWLLERRSTP